MDLSHTDKLILMELEYNFPFDSQPFKAIADKFSISEEDLLERVKIMVENGIIKRIGMYVSFRAKGMDGALVGANIPLENVEKFRKIALSIRELTHNFVRNHPRYNIWFVLKAENRSILNEKIKDLLSKVNSDDYVILYSKKTLKLSVKYDIIRGVSWSENSMRTLIENVPTADELGINKELLRDLSYPLKLTSRPFKEIAEKYNMGEDEIVDLIKELYEKNVIKDYGATLNGEKIGIIENGMVLLDNDNPEDACKKVALDVREATHVVLRESDKENWRFLCYSMIHATNKNIIKNVAKEIVKETNSKSYMILFSLENLKPGIVI